MAVNTRKLLFPTTMGRAGWELAATRDDIESVAYEPYMPTAEFHRLLADAEGVVLSLTPVGEAECAVAPRLRVAARIGVGYDAIDVPALTKRRIPVMLVGTANSTSVAEQAMFFMLALAKKGAAYDAMVREGRWPDRLKDLPIDLSGRTVLVLGFGRIGTRVVKRCVAFDMRVLVYDPYVPAPGVHALGAEPVGDLDVALAEADFVTVHCPKNAETTNLIDARRLGVMKPSAYVVNTARGGIINEAALYKALAAKRIAGAGIDVFEREPAAKDHPLFSLPNVILAPHMAGVSREAVDRMAVAAVRNVLSVLDGKPLRENAVNPEVFD